MLYVEREEWSRLENWVEKAYPEEACGVLVGRIENEKRIVEDVILARNQASETRRTFLIEASFIRALEGQLKLAGKEVLGFFHSHPSGKSTPSRRDLEWAWPWYSYVILGLRRRHVNEFAAWQLRSDRSGFDPERLRVVTPGSV